MFLWVNFILFYFVYQIRKTSIINSEELSEIDSSRRQSVDSRDREIAEKVKEGFDINTAALLYRAKKILNDPIYDSTASHQTTEVAINYREAPLENGYHQFRNIQQNSEKMRSHLFSLNFSPQEAEDFMNKKLGVNRTEFSFEQNQIDDSRVLEYSFESERGGKYGIEEEHGFISADIEDPDAILIHEIMKRGYTFEQAKLQSARLRQSQVNPSTNIVTPSENFHISPPSFIGR